MKKVRLQKIVLTPAKPLTKEELFVTGMIWGCTPIIYIDKRKYHDGDWIRSSKSFIIGMERFKNGEWKELFK